jgi:nucleoside-diphosphate-sugar epimerase
VVIEKDPLRTLVIGGAGYIGSYLVPLLSNSNRNVTVLGRRNLEHLSNNRHIKYIQGDFSDLNLLKKLRSNSSCLRIRSKFLLSKSLR